MPEFGVPQNLSLGSTVDDVIILQQFLIALELDLGHEPHGIFTETTALTVAEFKSRNGLVGNSLVDADTWMSLFHAMGPAPTQQMPTLNLQEFLAVSQFMAFASTGDIEGCCSH